MVNQMLRRLKSDILPVVAAKQLDTLIVFGGVNDLYSDLTAGRKNPVIERDLNAIYELAHGAGLRVVAITVAPWGGFAKYWNPRRGENTELLNSWILGQVAQNRVDVAVDAYPLLSCGKTTELCPDYATSGQDGLHPGQVGHERLGQKLIQLAFADCR
jgi:lysophospholipase L1-like esterase